MCGFPLRDQVCEGEDDPRRVGLVVDYKIEGDFPRYGNDDDRADEIAVWLLKTFMTKMKKHHTYRNSEPTTSILTITSNVVYGKATGALPDGRAAYKPFARAQTRPTARSRTAFWHP
jgi:pyruvate-formate lyase